MNNQEFVVLYEAPKIEKPELRLYYDKQGNVICYTCEKPEGDYIVIDALTYAAARPDLKIVDGKITQFKASSVVSKLMPSNKGTRCVKEDVSIVVGDDYKEEAQNWEMTTYEL